MMGGADMLVAWGSGGGPLQKTFRRDEERQKSGKCRDSGTTPLADLPAPACAFLPFITSTSSSGTHFHPTYHVRVVSSGPQLHPPQKSKQRYQDG